MEPAETERDAAGAREALVPDRWCWVLLAATCCLVSAAVAVTGRNRPFIGSPDQAAYAHQADRLLAGHGFSVNYIQHFYLRHSDIAHPEDHYGVGNGVLIAGAFALFGRSDWAATVPSLLAACIALPLLVYGGARAAGAPRVPALAGAAWLLFLPAFLGHARLGLADVQFAAATTAAWLALCTSRDRGLAGPLLSGLILGVAYYLKPAAVLLLPGLLGAAWLIGADRGLPLRRRAVSALLLTAAFGVAVAPWLLRNALLFGSPFYTANQHIGAARMYLPDFYPLQFRKVWWADPASPLPTLGLFLHERGLGAVLRAAWDNMATIRPESWDSVRLILPLALVGVCTSRRCAGLALCAACYVVLTAVVFPLLPRYLAPIHPAAGICAAFGAARVWEWGRRACKGLRRSGLKPTVSGGPRWGARLALLGTAGPLAVALLAVVALDASGMRGLAGAARYHAADGCDYDYPTEEQVTRGSADWARAELPPDARVMTPDCWRFAYYSGLASVNVPTDSPRAVASVVDAYRVDHIVLDDGLYSDKVPFAEAYLLEHGGEWQPIPTAPPGVRAYRRVTSSAADMSSTPM